LSFGRAAATIENCKKKLENNLKKLLTYDFKDDNIYHCKPPRKGLINSGTGPRVP
jgi:hypothetical protein